MTTFAFFGRSEMLRQYFSQRARSTEISGRAIMVGTVPVGTVTEYRGERIIIEAWLPRECHAGRFDLRARAWASSFHARGMFIAQVRNLATGRQFWLSEVHLIEPLT